MYISRRRQVTQRNLNLRSMEPEAPWHHGSNHTACSTPSEGITICSHPRGRPFLPFLICQCRFTAFSDLSVQSFVQQHNDNNSIQMCDPSYKSFCSHNSGRSKLLFTLFALAQLNLSSLQSAHNNMSSWVRYMEPWSRRVTQVAGLIHFLAGPATSERGRVFRPPESRERWLCLSFPLVECNLVWHVCV